MAELAILGTGEIRGKLGQWPAEDVEVCIYIDRV